ncbi:MAG: tetratricopeptide repeat protein [Muribaculaceae bacterium]|nr:tetratricopeptide repeat protein [Muribaculaceae bacterium]
MAAHRIRLLRLASLLAVAVLSVSAALASGPRAETAARAKARHYFRLASRAGAEEKYDLAYEYSAKALDTDPTFPEAAWLRATHRLMAEIDSLRSPAELKHTLQLASRYVDAYPDDFSESALYAYWASQMDALPEAARVYERIEKLFPAHTEILPELSDVYIRMGRNRDGVETLNRYETLEGPTPQLAMRKISIYIHEQDTIAALAEADSLVRRSPANAAFRIVRGSVWEYLDNPGNALVDYLDAERLAPDSYMPKFALAQYYGAQGDTLLFDQKTYEGLISDDLDVDDKISRAGEYIGRLMADSIDHTGRAASLVANLRERYPHDPKILTFASLYYYTVKDLEAAAETLEYATDLDPTNTDTWSTLLGMMFRESDFARTIEVYERMAQHVEPGIPDRQIYGISLVQLGQPARAAQEYRDILASIIPSADPDSLLTDKRLRSSLGAENGRLAASLYTLLGDALYELKDSERAFRAYDNSLFFDPYNPLTLNNYAYFLALSGGDLEKASLMSREAIEMRPDNPTFIDTHAWILYLSGDYEGAMEEQLKAIDIAAQQEEILSADFYDHLGDIYYKLGKTDQAVENWKKALETEPDNKEIQNKVKSRRVP